MTNPNYLHAILVVLIVLLSYPIGNSMQIYAQERVETTLNPSKAAPKIEKHCLTWDSPKLLEIERQWRAKMKTDLAKETAPNAYDKGGAMLVDLLKVQLSKEERREVVESFKTVPVDEHKQSKLAFALIHSLVPTLIEKKERETLVILLSVRCPRRIGLNTDIEFYLAIFEKKFEDPILILADAYAKSEDAAVRRNIANAFRRGFRASRIQGASDSEFIANSIKWYKENKNHLKLNLAYVHNGCMAKPENEYSPLFVTVKKE